MKNIMAEREVKKVRQTCFSLTPVPKCVGQCAESTLRKTRVALHCLPTKDAKAVRLMDKFKRGEILEELKDEKKIHWHKEVEVPEWCEADTSITH